MQNRARGGVGELDLLHSYAEPRMPETEKTLTSPGIIEPFSGRRRRKFLRFSGGIPRVATSQNSDINHTQEIILRNAARKSGLEEAAPLTTLDERRVVLIKRLCVRCGAQ